MWRPYAEHLFTLEGLEREVAEVHGMAPYVPPSVTGACKREVALDPPFFMQSVICMGNMVGA